MSRVNLEAILQTYSFSDILELNNLTEEDVLEYLLDAEFIELPDHLPIDA